MKRDVAERWEMARALVRAYDRCLPWPKTLEVGGDLFEWWASTVGVTKGDVGSLLLDGLACEDLP